MKKRYRHILLEGFLILALGLLTTGCVRVDKETDEKHEVDFTVVELEEVPKELQKDIEKEKKKEFYTTYCDSEYLYIAEGYGEQKTSGYSIQVEEVYASNCRLHVATHLRGPQKGEQINEVKSYPYVIIKLEARDETVVFD